MCIRDSCDSVAEYDGDQDGYTAATHGGPDCDDANAAIHPGAEEIWYDGIDQNCDGVDDDQDGDGLTLEEDCDDLVSTIGACVDEDDLAPEETIKQSSGCATVSALPPLMLIVLPILARRREV